MQKVFYAYTKETEVEISAVIGKKEKAYSDGEFIKNCLELVTRRMFPEKNCEKKIHITVEPDQLIHTN